MARKSPSKFYRQSNDALLYAGESYRGFRYITTITSAGVRSGAGRWKVDGDRERIRVYPADPGLMQQRGARDALLALDGARRLHTSSLPSARTAAVVGIPDRDGIYNQQTGGRERKGRDLWSTTDDAPGAYTQHHSTPTCLRTETTMCVDVYCTNFRFSILQSYQLPI